MLPCNHWLMRNRVACRKEDGEEKLIVLMLQLAACVLSRVYVTKTAAETTSSGST